MEEIWKYIIGYEGLYEVSNIGRVRSLGNNKSRKTKLLKPAKANNGYLKVGLCKNGKQKLFLVHRLVAEAFIPNPDNLPCVNHKNEIKTDNRVENLEHCTHQYNMEYSGNTKKALKVSNKVRKKPVIQYSKTGELIAEYESAKEASLQTKNSQGNITMCCRNQRKSTGGYIWEYKKV